MASIFFSFALIAMYDGSGQMSAINHKSTNIDRHPHDRTQDTQLSISLSCIWREIFEYFYARNTRNPEASFQTPVTIETSARAGLFFFPYDRAFH